MMKKHLLRSMLLLFALIAGSGTMWAADQTINITYTNFSNTSYNTSESTFTQSGITFGYVNAMKNGSNGTPSGWAKEQVIQTKSGGSIYNKTAIPGLKNIRVYIVANTNSFTVTSGSSAQPTTNSVTRPNTATGTESITYSSYSNRTVTPNQTTTASYYDFAVNNDYFKIAPGGSLYIWKIVLTFATYTLTYSATNGSISGVLDGTSTAVASGASVAEGGKVTLTATPAEGYVFSSWSDGGNNSTLSSTSDNPTTFTMGTADVTVTANFVESGTPITYSVTYDANGATSGSVPTDDNSYEANASVTVLGNTGNLAKTGNAFSGWNTQADGEGTNYAADATFNITGNTTLYAKWTPYTITAASNNNSYGTVSLEGNVITATPAEGYTYASPSYTVTTGSATVVQEDDEFTVTPTSDCTVIINFAAIPTYTAHFSVNGTIDNDNDFTGIEGAAITFPAKPADINGMRFVGWLESTIEGTTNTAPAFVTSAQMGDADVTFYAVFADAKGSSETKQDAITSSVTGITTSSYSNFSNKSVSGGSGAKYAGNCAGSSTYIQLRTSSNTGLVSTTSGGKAKKVTLAWSSTADRALQVYGSNTAYTGLSDIFDDNKKGTLLGTLTYGSATELSITGNYAYIGIKPDAGKSGASQLSTITIDWEVSNITYSNYCTTVVTAAVEKPQITVAENPFLFSTQVTITCETEGATIYYSYDNSTWNEYTGQLTITETKTIYAKGVKGSDESRIAEVTATKNLAEPTVTISGNNLNDDLAGGTNVSAGTLTANVTYNNAAIEGATVTWGSGNTSVATIDPSTGAVTLLATGDVTFTATYAGNGDYAEATATYNLTVIDSEEPGTLYKPYSVAEAINAIDNNGTVTNVYVRGIVSQVDEFNSTDGTITYWISDDGTTTGTQFQVYKGKYDEDEGFSSINGILVGDEVTLTGNIQKDNSIYGFASGSWIESLVRTHPFITFDTYAVNATAAETEGTLPITYQSITADIAEVKFFESDGTTAATYDWIQAEITKVNDTYNLYYVISANESTEPRTAYMKVYALDDDANDVYSRLITVTQAGFVVDYATLPFEWDDKSTPTGVTNSGVGTYNSSPYLKFDTEGDYLILKFNEAPGTLTFDVKGNSGNSNPTSGTFTVQTSVDGNSYTDLENYVNLSNTKQSETFTNLDKNVRYIKWIYTSRESGNVALGNIKLDNATVAVTVTASGYLSYCSPYKLDFSETAVKAYKASVDNTGKVTLTKVDVVPANTGVVLFSSEAKEANEATDYAIPVTDAAASDVTGNEMVGVLERTQVVWNVGDKYNYILQQGVFNKANGGYLKANRAYLSTTYNVEAPGARSLEMVFDDETTDVESVHSVQCIVHSYYNLNGQRVQNPQKGLYIVNGKKVVIK